MEGPGYSLCLPGQIPHINIILGLRHTLGQVKNSSTPLARPNRIELIRLDMMFALNQGHTIDGSVQGGIFGRHHNCQYPGLWFPSRLFCSALLRLEEKKFSAEIRSTVCRFRSGSRHGQRSQPQVKSGSLVPLQIYYITCIQKPK